MFLHCKSRNLNTLLWFIFWNNTFWNNIPIPSSSRIGNQNMIWKANILYIIWLSVLHEFYDGTWHRIKNRLCIRNNLTNFTFVSIGNFCWIMGYFKNKIKVVLFCFLPSLLLQVALIFWWFLVLLKWYSFTLISVLSEKLNYFLPFFRLQILEGKLFRLCYSYLVVYNC